MLILMMMVEMALLPVRIFGALLRVSALRTILLISLAFSLVSGLFGLLGHALPWILIGAGIYIVVKANGKDGEAFSEKLMNLLGSRRSA